MEINDWHVVLACGQELHGKHIGSFQHVKLRRDLLEVYVLTPRGRVACYRRKGERPVALDFFVHHALEMNQEPVKHYKLVTLYPDKRYIRHVHADGSYRTEEETVSGMIPQKVRHG